MHYETKFTVKIKRKKLKLPLCLKKVPHQEDVWRSEGTALGTPWRWSASRPGTHCIGVWGGGGHHSGLDKVAKRKKYLLCSCKASNTDRPARSLIITLTTSPTQVLKMLHTLFNAQYIHYRTQFLELSQWVPWCQRRVSESCKKLNNLKMSCYWNFSYEVGFLIFVVLKQTSSPERYRQ